MSYLSANLAKSTIKAPPVTELYKKLEAEYEKLLEFYSTLIPQAFDGVQLTDRDRFNKGK